MPLSLKVKRRVIVSSWVVLVVLLYMFKNASFLARVLSTMGLVALFYTVDHYFKADFKPRHYLFIYFMAAAGFLLSPLYYLYSLYDKILHLIVPILFSSIVFHLVSKLRLEKKWELFFTFAIVLGSLALFELGEFGLDYFFNMQMQGVYMRDASGLEKYDILMDRNDDTMVDILLGTIGSGAYWLTRLTRHSMQQRARQKRVEYHRSKSHRAR
ncbi:MAG: hypothetical protein AABX53_03490 [Nanoarchaeota archaeon]